MKCHSNRCVVLKMQYIFKKENLKKSRNLGPAKTGLCLHTKSGGPVSMGIPGLGASVFEADNL